MKKCKICKEKIKNIFSYNEEDENYNSVSSASESFHNESYCSNCIEELGDYISSLSILPMVKSPDYIEIINRIKKQVSICDLCFQVIKSRKNEFHIEIIHERYGGIYDICNVCNNKIEEYIKALKKQ